MSLLNIIINNSINIFIIYLQLIYNKTIIYKKKFNYEEIFNKLLLNNFTTIIKFFENYAIIGRASEFLTKNKCMHHLERIDLWEQSQCCLRKGLKAIASGKLNEQCSLLNHIFIYSFVEMSITIFKQRTLWFDKFLTI